MPQRRCSVQPDIVDAIVRDILPIILEANADSSEALSVRPERYSEASMGYTTWDHCRHAIREKLSKSEDWRIDTHQNDLVVICLAGPKDFRFRICRVAPDTRLPTSGKRAKQSACPLPLLSEELAAFVCHHREHLVGYDTGMLSGIGAVTLQSLYTISEDVQSETLITLYDASTQAANYVPAPQESIPKGTPSRRTVQPNLEPKVGRK